MPKDSISSGQKIGYLTVEEKVGKDKNNYTLWRCRCRCGGEIVLDSRAIKRGKTMDCGCRNYLVDHSENVAGQKFGKLRAECRTGEVKNGWAVWHCICECGGSKDVPLNRLQKGLVQSCGCIGHPPLKNLVGKRFGSLVVTGYYGKIKGMHRWECLCDCGRTTIVGQTLLQTGKTESCGCKRRTFVYDHFKFVDGTSVSRLESAQQNKLSKTNKSGYNGVYYSKRRKKWVAQITFKGKTYYLGCFEKLDDAVKARKDGEKLYVDFLENYYMENPNMKPD